MKIFYDDENSRSAAGKESCDLSEGGELHRTSRSIRGFKNNFSLRRNVHGDEETL